jgi:hypothetical protein
MFYGLLFDGLRVFLPLFRGSNKRLSPRFYSYFCSFVVSCVGAIFINEEAVSYCK